MKTFEDYLRDAKQGESVRRLTSMAEFQGLLNILKQMYKDSLETLSEKESLEDRIRIKFIKDLLDSVESDIKIGEMANEALAQKRFSNP